MGREGVEKERSGEVGGVSHTQGSSSTAGSDLSREAVLRLCSSAQNGLVATIHTETRAKRNDSKAAVSGGVRRSWRKREGGMDGPRMSRCSRQSYTNMKLSILNLPGFPTIFAGSERSSIAPTPGPAVSKSTFIMRDVSLRALHSFYLPGKLRADNLVMKVDEVSGIMASNMPSKL
ncbi:hypothetical protein BDZ97DRAFT_1054434 [Flammula alnicola]|nr:hypothetical protein BDZ97DRAFT_1054434 [Flammula alnicola]